MRNHDLHFFVAAALCCFLCSGCASTSAPRGWLIDPDKMPADPYGGWVRIRDHNKMETRGELIAVMPDTVFVADSLLHVIPVSEILSARLELYNAGGGVSGGVAGGTLSTLTNGWFLALTMPMWLLGGSIAATARSYEPIISYPGAPLSQFVPFARFPQGFPTGLDRETLRMKRTTMSKK